MALRRAHTVIPQTIEAAEVTTATQSECSAVSIAWEEASGSVREAVVQEVASLGNHHPRYYFHDGNAVLQVETTLYRLHRSVLLQHTSSGPLADALRDLNKGSDDHHPIKLDGQSKKAFDLFLSFFSFCGPSVGIEDKPASDILTFLQVAHQWGFGAYKRAIIRKLCTRKGLAAERVFVGRTYAEDTQDAVNILFPAFEDLLNPPPLTGEHGKLLSRNDLLTLVRLQHYEDKVVSPSLLKDVILGHKQIGDFELYLKV